MFKGEHCHAPIYASVVGGQWELRGCVQPPTPLVSLFLSYDSHLPLNSGWSDRPHMTECGLSLLMKRSGLFTAFKRTSASACQSCAAVLEEIRHNTMKYRPLS